jgi:hypothetical protein
MADGEQRLRAAFFEGQELRNTLTVLCENCKSAKDPVTATVLIVLNCPVHLQLTAVGWQPFRGKELTFPYHMMTPAQKQVFLDLFESHGGACHVYEHAILFKLPGPPLTLSPLDVLESLCSLILDGTAYPDKRWRVAVCNILLQRVQASMPLDKATQSALNARLFPPPHTVHA